MTAPAEAGSQQRGTGPPAPWPEARRTAAAAGSPLPARSLPLGRALGHVLARPLAALTDLPAFDTSAMDGWAVAGAGPWRLRGRVLAGDTASAPLDEGAATRIATGAQLPHGATAVVRREDGKEDCGADGGADGAVLTATSRPEPGQDIRPRGQECRVGDELLPGGCRVTAAVLGLAAASGYDALDVVSRPTVELLVLGDELLAEGVPGAGRVRDALGPLLPPWLHRLGADVLGTRRVGDTAAAVRDAVSGSAADVVITTGGTAEGPVDFVHRTLRDLGARMLVDRVAVRPGHPMLLAELPPGDGAERPRHLIGLPGNPLAAVSGVVTLAGPLLRRLGGRAEPRGSELPLTGAVHGHPTDTRLVPVALRDGGAAPLRFHGPAMLRGLAAADALAVVPPGGAEPGASVLILELAW